MTMAFGQPTLTWNLGRDLHQLLTYRFMVDALAAGTIVALVAGPIGWFMVLRRQTFAGHTLAVVGFPGAAGAAADRGERDLRLPGLLHHRGAGDRGRTPLAAGSVERGVRRHRHHAGLCAGLRLPVRDPLCRQRRRGGQPAVRQLPGHHRDPGGGAGCGGCGGAGGARDHRPTPAVRHRRSRDGAEPGRARAAPVGGLPGAAGRRRGRDQPDHRVAVGVRPARPPGRHRAGAHRPSGSQPGAGRGPGPGRHLDGPGRVVLLDVPDRLLDHQRRLRRLPGGPGVGSRRAGLGPAWSAPAVGTATIRAAVLGAES